ncbi:MAG: hypothetical protein AAGF58_08280 [Pseudomonadota bacterium]
MTNAPSYRDLAHAFLEGCVDPSGTPDIAAIFHKVRNLRYASRGQRDPHSVLQRGEGSCSGKHLLLRDLLRLVGEEAEVEIAEGDFAAGVPAHPTMTGQLASFTRAAGVRDFHQYVVWHSTDGEVRLDATWPDSVARLGLATNAGWTVGTETALALEPVKLHGRPVNLIEKKQALLENLSPAERAKRLEFLALLTEWLDAQIGEDNSYERRTG